MIEENSNMDKVFKNGKNILFGTQSSILSAASVIMIMMLVSQFLGYLRQRILLHYFTEDLTSLFFAAFRLPDLIFEVLVFGAFSSAFIPVFSKLVKKGNGEAWDTAAEVLNLGLLLFIPVAALIAIFAHPIYQVITPGYSFEQTEIIARTARLLFIAQGFFIISYVLTGVLESLHRFLIPALAPLFYNLGIILGTILLSPSLGLMGPTLGVLIGAAFHLLIQLPFAMRLGFRFKLKFVPNDNVKKIGRLAGPRLVDLSFQQVAKVVELNLSSLISTGAYTYLTLGNTLQLFPVRLFGIAVAKAALPTLSQQEDDPGKFKTTLLSTVHQIMFLIFPLATALIVLRIPIVRLAYGTDLFDWESTVQTGLVLSAFAVGVPFEAALAILNRAYYALHDTKTPVVVSIVGVVVNIVSSLIFIHVMGLPAWSLAAAFTLGVVVQTLILFFLLESKLDLSFTKSLIPIIKNILACLVSGSITFFLLKLFDRSVWVKRLSFLGSIDINRGVVFEKFVLDTRYTINVVILSLGVLIIGFILYVLFSFILRSKELFVLYRFAKSFRLKSPLQEKEMIAPAPESSSSN